MNTIEKSLEIGQKFIDERNIEKQTLEKKQESTP